mgnify:CR=1 FL=1
MTLQGLAGRTRDPEAPELRRILDVDNREFRPHGEGLVMTDRLAAKLGLAVGEAVEVEVLEGRRRTLSLRLDATVREMMGLNAYMGRAALNRALGEPGLASQFAVAVERGREPALLAALKGLPGVIDIRNYGMVAAIEQKILADDPFQTLDQEGVGELIRIATERGRATRPGMKMGICGEQGGAVVGAEAADQHGDALLLEKWR